MPVLPAMDDLPRLKNLLADLARRRTVQPCQGENTPWLWPDVAVLDARQAVSRQARLRNPGSHILLGKAKDEAPGFQPAGPSASPSAVDRGWRYGFQVQLLTRGSEGGEHAGEITPH